MDWKSDEAEDIRSQCSSISSAASSPLSFVADENSSPQDEVFTFLEIGKHLNVSL
jgi:hypothetical protein